MWRACAVRWGRMLVPCCVLLPILLLWFPVTRSGAEMGHIPGEYYRLVDEEQRTLFRTSRSIEVGDQFLTPDNLLYEVREVDVEGRIAHTELVEEVTLPPVGPVEGAPRDSDARGPHPAEADFRGAVGFYHTHNAESFVPSDGTHSIDGKGGIHRVGRAFADALRERGITPIFFEDLHLPHDRGAYRRSRDTALRLLAQNPDTIYDIHRDAAPAEEYRAEVSGLEVARIMFVVGTQNPGFSVNREYALSLKRVADVLHEGLIRGVWFMQGGYNQDIMPLSLLLEVGSHLNTRQEAKQGIGLFADVVDLYFYGPEGLTGRERDAPERSALALVLEVMGLFVLVGAAFYVVRAGGWRAARKKAKDALEKWLAALRTRD